MLFLFEKIDCRKIEELQLKYEIFWSRNELRFGISMEVFHTYLFEIYKANVMLEVSMVFP